MKFRTLVLSLFAFAVIIAGCGDDDNPVGTNDPDSGVDTVSFASDVQPILNSSCALTGCHIDGMSAGGFSLGTLGNSTYSATRNGTGDNGAIIVAGSGSTSNLYLKTTSSPPFGGQMPVGGSITSAQQLILKNWIDQGALDN